MKAEDHTKVIVQSPCDLDHYKSKVFTLLIVVPLWLTAVNVMNQIVLKITFQKKSMYWFMKVIFPLDVITVTGFGAFLVIPSLVSPTQDQQISILTFLAGILIALVSK
jgi:hypothetical protein